jgi:hypothetical protein
MGLFADRAVVADSSVPTDVDTVPDTRVLADLDAFLDLGGGVDPYFEAEVAGLDD